MLLRRMSSSTLHPFHRRVWDLLRPSHWVPASIAEHSASKRATTQEGIPSNVVGIPWGWNMDELAAANKAFFADVPTKFHVADAMTPPVACGIANYSYSSAYFVDKEGKRVQSIRRRYEDSTGRLKAMHTRTIQGTTMTSEWSREHYGDDGSHSASVTQGTIGEFENQWRATPFGQAAVATDGELPSEEFQPKDFDGSALQRMRRRTYDGFFMKQSNAAKRGTMDLCKTANTKR
ncbi:Aste57867_8803 [Aphanomyces stellatus]|uniref:Aste57867_8803 protein n=1 Tax=Aphanomyces stellatus TaxID=120398 RepID=A0A485KL63_9STRA|nr:hypothetical protein As57867_008768 [Aphanomyces stellatus]VFT85689.1 Aste57867_8803 [Aphanomyces stellatus]